jgi:hypothetical protein
MKYCLTFLLMSSALTAFADKIKVRTFEEEKQMILSHIDQRMQTLETSKTCINKASSHEELRNCRHSEKEAMKAIRKEWKEDKKQ